MAIGIIQTQVKGEIGTEFEKRADKGPFECGNCEYFKDGLCHQEIMMKRSKQPKSAEGFVKVDERDCCEYVDRLGKRIRWSK
jgi:hypothetical protein